MHDGLRVIDADAHKRENPVVFFDYPDPAYRDRLGSRVDRYGRQRLVLQDWNPATGRNDLERVLPQPDGPGKDRAFDHDPVDFFRRGQVVVSFESDDPAPAYLREAVGSMGEDLACFSADYGHWDGVLTDCVRNVARVRPYERGHLATLLAENCLRFYGPRLASRLGDGPRAAAQPSA